ncbi:hypothetical protein L6452_13897 [Arctium lappa]|uniref:Uncharacterized protein n=1 Tax=Arctium lappa TaxID=4217 RepID=A0ACB9CJF3_ARCLA|nr:hypothetical protein L6452_13897 [Arctium lappa]
MNATEQLREPILSAVNMSRLKNEEEALVKSEIVKPLDVLSRQEGFHRRRTGGQGLGFIEEGDEGEGSLLEKEDGRGVQDSIILI